MNIETASAEPAVDTETAQVELPALALFDPARLPERVEGFTHHPDLDLMLVGEDGDRRIDPAKVTAAGYSLQIVEKANGLDASQWMPEGEGQLVSVYDNEHGIFAAFVTPTGNWANAEPEAAQAEFPANYNDAEQEIELSGPRQIARDTLMGDLMHSILDEVKAIPDVWQKLPQYKQDQVLARVEGRSRTIIGRIVEIIAADARPSIPASVESVTVKDGIKAVLAVSRSSAQRHDLVDAQGSSVLIVIADAEPYTGGDKPKSQKDQCALDLKDTKPVADSCPATAE